jgi:hypothetical protein
MIDSVIPPKEEVRLGMEMLSSTLVTGLLQMTRMRLRVLVEL